MTWALVVMGLLMAVAVVEAAVIVVLSETRAQLSEELEQAYDHLTDEIRARVVREGRFAC